jgi:hypothetical protein
VRTALYSRITRDGRPAVRRTWSHTGTRQAVRLSDGLEGTCVLVQRQLLLPTPSPPVLAVVLPRAVAIAGRARPVLAVAAAVTVVGE